jgi:hypothetical protein
VFTSRSPVDFSVSVLCGQLKKTAKKKILAKHSGNVGMMKVRRPALILFLASMLGLIPGEALPQCRPFVGRPSDWCVPRQKVPIPFVPNAFPAVPNAFPAVPNTPPQAGPIPIGPNAFADAPFVAVPCWVGPANGCYVYFQYYPQLDSQCSCPQGMGLTQ